MTIKEQIAEEEKKHQMLMTKILEGHPQVPDRPISATLASQSSLPNQIAHMESMNVQRRMQQMLQEVGETARQNMLLSIGSASKPERSSASTGRRIGKDRSSSVPQTTVRKDTKIRYNVISREDAGDGMWV